MFNNLEYNLDNILLLLDKMHVAPFKFTYKSLQKNGGRADIYEGASL